MFILTLGVFTSFLLDSSMSTEPYVQEYNHGRVLRPRDFHPQSHTQGIAFSQVTYLLQHKHRELNAKMEHVLEHEQ